MILDNDQSAEHFMQLSHDSHYAEALKGLHQGLAALNQGHYESAKEHFSSLTHPIFTALGFCRIATRIGQYNKALDWARAALVYSQRYELSEITSLYREHDLLLLNGAIGELFVRGNNVQQALLHMQIAYQLRSKVGNERQRQYTYLSIPLARLGQASVAEANYMRAYILAKQQQDNVAMSHALVRRAALSWHKNKASYWQESLALLKQIPEPCPKVVAIFKLLLEGLNIDFDRSELLWNLANPIPLSIEHRLSAFFNGDSQPSLPDIPNPPNLLGSATQFVGIHFEDLSIGEADYDAISCSPTNKINYLTHLFI